MRHEVRCYTDARLAGKVETHVLRRFTRRMLGIVILSLVLTLTYFGYTNKEAFAGHPLFFAFYWILTLVLAFSLIFIALIDVRAVFKQNLKSYLEDGGTEGDRLERFITQEREKTERKTS